jgi:hypothetical protein
MNIHKSVYLVVGILLTLIISLFCGGYSDTTGNTSDVESLWEGTWTDANYSLSLSQNGSTITGIATSSNASVAEPFRLSGTVSDDGMSLQSVLTSSGTLTLNLSEDKMMFYGSGTIDSLNNTSQPYTYVFNAIRNGTPIIPDQEWTGIWTSKRNLMNFTQEGTSVRGEYHPLTTVNFGGVVNGTISQDGKTLSMTRISPENVTFILSEDGKTMIEGDCTEEKISFNGYCLNLIKKE